MNRQYPRINLILLVEADHKQILKIEKIGNLRIFFSFYQKYLVAKLGPKVLNPLF